MLSIKKGTLGNSARFLAGALICSFAGIFVLSAGPLTAPGALTVGEFALLVANRVQQPETHQGELTEDAALLLLQKAGIKTPPSHSSSVTEGDAVQVFRQFGINLETRNPGGTLGRDKAAALVNAFGSSLTAEFKSRSWTLSSGMPGVESSRPADAPPVAESVFECQQMPRTQDCQFCCREFLGGDASTLKINNICAKACNSAARRNVSPSDPLP
jgi:hypothetical protein